MLILHYENELCAHRNILSEMIATTESQDAKWNE